MTKKEMLEQLSKEKKGILRTADAQALGISRPYFLEFIQKHGYEKMAHGIYLSPDAWEDGMYILQSRCPHVVFSHESALYLLGLTDREPMQHTVTVKSGYKTTNLKEEGGDRPHRKKRKISDRHHRDRDAHGPHGAYL